MQICPLHDEKKKSAQDRFQKRGGILCATKTFREQLCGYSQGLFRLRILSPRINTAAIASEWLRINPPYNPARAIRPGPP
jgi:hypothetical protein